MYKYLQGSDIAWPTSFDNEALGHRIIYLATVGMALLIARYENNNVDRVWRYAKMACARPIYSGNMDLGFGPSNSLNGEDHRGTKRSSLGELIRSSVYLS